MKLGRGSLLLLATAGANDPVVLNDRVPSDAIQREITVGMALYVTPTFAFVASLASLLMIFEDQSWRWPVAVPLALLWAVAIFTIDRSLVLSMSRAPWPAILARLLLGTLVAVSISMPIDIALFQDRVKSVLLSKRQDEKLASSEKIARIHDIDGATRATERAQADLDRAKAQVDELPADVLSLRKDTQACNVELDRRRQKLEPQIADFAAQIGALEKQKQVLQQIDPGSRQLQALEGERLRLIGQRNAMRTEINVAVGQCERFRRDARAAEQQYREHARQRVVEAAAQSNLAREDASAATRKAQQDVDKANAVVEASLADSFVAKAEALHHLVWSEPSAAVTYFLILIVFITVEMAAILAKLMAGRGCIDKLLSAKGEHIVFEETAELTKRQLDLQREVAIDEVVHAREVELAQEDPAYARDKLAARNVLATHRELLRELHAFLDENDRVRERADQGSGRRASAVGQALHALDRAAADAVMRALGEASRTATDATENAAAAQV